MLQLKCIQVSERSSDSFAQVQFELLLNGISTNQFATFSLQPDFCELGEIYSLTADDFLEPSAQQILMATDDSLN